MAIDAQVDRAAFSSLTRERAVLGLLEGQTGNLAFTAIAPVFSASIQWIILMGGIWGLGWLLNGAVTGMVLARARAQLVLAHAA